MMSQEARRDSARAHAAPGRFLWRVGLAAGLAAGVALAGGCASAPDVAVEPEATAASDPVVAPGRLAAGEEARAAALFRSAQEALEAGRPSEAAELAGTVVERYPAWSGSGRALRLQAEAAVEAGRWDVAATAAARYDALLPDDDPRRGPIRLLGGRALLARGDAGPALEVLGTVPPDPDAEVLEATLATAREAAASLPAPALEAALGDLSVGHPVNRVVRARLAAALQVAGDDARARELAEDVLAAGEIGEEADLAREVLAGALAPAVRSVRIASVLPTSGSPALQDFASLIAEGVEVAAVSAGGDLVVEVEAVDDHGEVDETVAAVRALDGGSVLGAVGFLEDHALEAAGQARTGGLPLVSPTARTPSSAGPGAYSLAGADPEAARTMARYAADRGYARVAVLHSRAPESAQEADAFAAELQERGVPVVGRYAYDAGVTFFQDPIRSAREALRLQEIRALNLGPDDTLRVEELPPVALFLPIPSEDVEYLAPQVTFFGLDTLGIDVLGGAAWTDPGVLSTVATRHTDGVVALAPVGAGPGTSGYQDFRAAYERHFQRTLVSPVPALGYDATLLLLEAIRRGADSPGAVRQAMEGIRGLEGATGVFSVENGRVLRRQEVVRIMNGSVVPTGG